MPSAAALQLNFALQSERLPQAKFGRGFATQRFALRALLYGNALGQISWFVNIRALSQRRVIRE